MAKSSTPLRDTSIYSDIYCERCKQTFVKRVKVSMSDINLISYIEDLEADYKALMHNLETPGELLDDDAIDLDTHFQAIANAMFELKQFLIERRHHEL